MREATGRPAPLPGPLGAGLATLTAGAWQARRRLYEWGVLSPERVPARVVSVGNLTVGGAGKTTLVLHLAARLRAAGVDVAVVTRRYRPGPAGFGDEELLYRAALGPERTFAGKVKRDLARAAAASGAGLILVDDGFSHWSLERDLDLVLLDRTDPWGGSRLLPAGRLREPIVALQRAAVVIVTRLEPNEDPEPLLAEVRTRAPGALVAAARHAVVGVRTLDGGPGPERERSERYLESSSRGPARVLTATGNPEAVASSAVEAGFSPVTLVARRDHHWFSRDEAERERRAAAGGTLLLTAKDAVRWPEGASRDGVQVLETAWQWVRNGDAVERMVREPRP